MSKEKFEVKLPLFEGPFDLLLYFIERDELDIYDIPISDITEDFLNYMHHLENLNIEVASEFILVASTLMRIKAKMLLPRPVLDEQGEEIDPREELVRHLLEYKKYKSVVSTLSAMEEERISREKRGNLKHEIKKLAETTNVEAELQDLDLYKLMKAFHKAIDKMKIRENREIHSIVQYPYTLEQQKSRLMERLVYGKKLSFVDMIAEKPDRVLVIFNFLSILELVQSKLISIQIGEGFNNFWIQRNEEKQEA